MLLLNGLMHFRLARNKGATYVTLLWIASQKWIVADINEYHSLKFRDKNRKWGAKIETGYMFRDYNDRTEYWSGSIGGMDYNQGVAYTDAM